MTDAAAATPDRFGKDPEDTERAVSRLLDTVIGLLRSAEFDGLRDLFPPSLRPLVSPEALRTAWHAVVGSSQEAAEVGTPVFRWAADGTVEALVPVRAASSPGTTVVLTIAGGTSLVGLRVVSHEIGDWQPPDYADPARFDEIEYVLGAPPADTPAILSRPRIRGRAPAVLLLGGSGPVDRDATLWPYKPFKDLAWGLASRGIAVLRFDKITYSHPGALAQVDGVTIADEYLHHADLALKALRAREDIDASMIFVLGHSLGGTVSPRVVRRHPDLAGMILLAAAALPLHWTVVRQVRQLLSSFPDNSVADPTLDALVAQARLVDAPALTASTPRSLLPLALPASYWLDLREYRAIEVAASLPQPVLVLQGGRDIQTTEADDLTAWRSALAERPDVEIKVFPDDDHLFIPTGPETPAGVPGRRPGHLDEAVMQAVADWVTKTTGPPAPH